MTDKLSRARVALLRAMSGGAELTTTASFGYPSWVGDNQPDLPPRQQAVRAAFDAGHLVKVREIPAAPIWTPVQLIPTTQPVYGISQAGRDALASSQEPAR